MSSTLSPPPSTPLPLPAARRPWADTWLQSDLVGVPVTLAFSGAIAISFGLYLVLDKSVGLFMGQLLFPLALLTPVALLLHCGREPEPNDGIHIAAGSGRRRVLILANAGLEHPDGRDDLFRIAARAEKAMIIAPVAAATWLHALADDVDSELRTAQARVESVVAALRFAGVDAEGRADIAAPATALIDGLREFGASDILVLASEGKSWAKATSLATGMRIRLDPSVDELDPSEICRAVA